MRGTFSPLLTSLMLLWACHELMWWSENVVWKDVRQILHLFRIFFFNVCWRSHSFTFKLILCFTCCVCVMSREQGKVLAGFLALKTNYLLWWLDFHISINNGLWSSQNKNFAFWILLQIWYFYTFFYLYIYLFSRSSHTHLFSTVIKNMWPWTTKQVTSVNFSK